MTYNENMSMETTRRKSLEVMHKGMISYKLAYLGWDVSDHYGDGYDLIAVKKQENMCSLVKIELKAVDLSTYSKKARGFSQAVSVNEIVAATHIIVSLFDGISPKGHFIMTMKQAFEAKRKTRKYSKFKNFQEYRRASAQVARTNVSNRKGSKEETIRLSLDIGSTFNRYEQGKWDCWSFKDKWENLHITEHN